MTDEELKIQGPPKILDNTMRTEYRSCPRRFYYFRRGYTYAGNPIYFTSGTTWHLFQEQWHLNSDLEHPLRVQKAIMSAHDFYQENIGNTNNSFEIPKNDSWENLEQLMNMYIVNYPREPWRMVSGETGWLWPIDPSRGLSYGGSLDGYIEWPGFGTLAIENKTVGMYIGDNYLNQWAFAPQVTGIIWGLSEFLGGEVFGCLMNLTSKIISGPRSKRSTPQFTRRLERRSEARLSEFKSEIIRDFDLLEMEWESWVWPMTVNPIECAGGIGRKPCLFKDLCMLPIHFTEIVPEEFSHIKLRTEEWLPWERKSSYDA